MLKYILKRILLLIPVLIGATLIVFFVMDMTPGDPAVAKLGVDATAEQIEELREEMGLNDPFLVRYGRFVLNLVQGDLGTSYKTGLDVMQQIMQRIPYTFLLSFAALLFAVIVGIPAGIISARHQYTVFDNCTMVLTLIGASAPHFWLGLMGVIIFAVNLGWLPAAYTASGSLALGIILPMLTLGMNSTALVTRMTRSAMLDVMNQDYVDTARAKGVSERVVVFRHMLRNALIPIITVLGLQFGNLLGGAVTTETIFAWPGIGRYIVESISNKDTPCVLGAVVMLLGYCFGPRLLRLMNTPESCMDDAVLYIKIYFAGAIASMLYNMGAGILRAVGDSKRPLYFLIVASIVNIVLDIVLVAVIPLGVAGAAIATVASQVVSAVLTVRCIHGSQGMPWHLQLKNIRIERSVLLAICRIGLPGAAQSALYSISNMTIQSAINGFGTVAVAAWSVYGKIDFLFWMTVSSFGIAVTTFAGQNFGARQYDRVRRGTMTCLAMTAGTTLCISLALYPLAQLLFRLFSSDDAVVAQGVQMMHYLVPVYMTYICIEIFSGALRGCGDVRVPTIITVFAVCIMRIVWLAVALPFKHELSVVEFSYPLTWITATVLFAIYYTKGGWMQRCIAAQNAKTQG